jgi:PAS domain S-box-containing protein
MFVPSSPRDPVSKITYYISDQQVLGTYCAILMKLQKKTLMVFVVLLISVLVVISIFFSTILLASYSALEVQYVEKDLDQAVNKLNDEYLTLSAIVSDWGPWDDTYNFVNGNDPEYIQSNLLVPGFDNLNLNLIVITNSKGEVVYSGAYDLVNKETVPVPAFVQGPLDLTHPLMNMSDPHYITAGILLLPENPMIVASQPIVRSDFSGQPQGVVIMGRYLDKAEISRLAELTRPSLAFTRTDDPALPPDLVLRTRENRGTAPGIIRQLNGNEIAGYALIQDIYGKDALVLQITEARDIYRQGLNTTMQVLLIIILSGVFLGLVVIILLDRFVLERMNSLALQVYTIGKSGSTTEHVKIGGDDELSGLAAEINRMLDTIEQAQAKVQASEARFRGLAENLPLHVIIFEMDTTGSLLYVNRSGVEIFGITEEKIAKGINIRHYLSTDNIEMMERGLAAVMSGGWSPGEVYTLTQRDGNLMRAIVYTSLIYREGRVAGFQGIVIDITERLTLEEALKESEEKYRALAENSADIIFSLNDTGTFTYISPQVSRYGYTPPEIVGKGIQQFIHPDDQAKVFDNYQQEMQDGTSITSTFRIVDKQGDLHWIEENSNIKRDEQGNPKGMVGILRDVTDRVRAEEALRQSRERLENILRASPVVVFETDPDGNLLFASDLWEQLIGCPFETMKGRHWSEVLHPEDKARLAQDVRLQSRNLGATGAEARIIRADGSILWTFGQSVTVYNPDGSIRGHVGTITDITERKVVEEEIVRTLSILKSTMESTADGILVADGKGGIVLFNVKFKEMWGIPEAVIVSKNDDTALSFVLDQLKEPEIFLRSVQDLYKTPEKTSFDLLELKDGRVFERYSQPQRIGDAVSGRVFSFRDISERKRVEEALRDRTAFFEALVESSLDGILVIGENQERNVINKRLIEMWNVPATILKDPNDAALLEYVVNRCSEPEKFYEKVRYLYSHKSETSRDIVEFKDGMVFDRSSSPVIGKNGEYLGRIWTFQDITERRKMEETLAESAAEYRALTENTSDILFSINMAGIFTYISPQVNKYGYLVSEITGKSIRDVVYPEDIDRVEAKLVSDLEQGAQFHSTFRVLDKWGNVHWFDEEGTLRLDQYGTPIGIYGVLRDDSERRRAEEQLTESKNLYMAIFDNTGSAMIIIASDTSIILANPGWASLTGIAQEECAGRSWTEFIHPEDLEMMKKYYHGRREDPAHVPREYLFRLIDASGNVHSCIVSVVTIPGTTDSIAAVVDISERKRAEDAIELANKKLNLMNNITRHDILNTITGLLGCLDMADATTSPEDKVQLLNDVRDLTRIIQRQITFTREYQEVGVHLPLWQNVRGVIDKVLQNFEKSGIHFEIDPGNMEVYADPLLEKVFYNLADNAMRYGETITTIRISTLVSGNNALLIFEDDGAGIPVDQKTRVFERGVGRNTGMGLFLTQEILAITGITIRENGEPGKGARFEMLIPWGSFRSGSDTLPNG